ncbi:Restriction endonuclease protein, partial [Halorhabdus tiamatea SARL4B]
RRETVERRIEVLADGDAETGRRSVRTSGGLPVGDVGPIRPLSDAEHSELVPVEFDDQLPAVRAAETDAMALAVFEIAGGQHPALAVPRESRAQYVRHVESLGEQSLRHTVADVWRDLGWAVERTDGGSPFLARRPDVGATLLLSVRRRASPVGPSVVTALAGRTANRDGDPWPILVTTDPIEPESVETAASAGVTIIDARGLAELCYLNDGQSDGARESRATNTVRPS